MKILFVFISFLIFLNITYYNEKTAKASFISECEKTFLKGNRQRTKQRKNLKKKKNGIENSSGSVGGVSPDPDYFVFNGKKVGLNTLGKYPYYTGQRLNKYYTTITKEFSKDEKIAIRAKPLLKAETSSEQDKIDVRNQWLNWHQIDSNWKQEHGHYDKILNGMYPNKILGRVISAMVTNMSGHLKHYVRTVTGKVVGVFSTTHNRNNPPWLFFEVKTLEGNIVTVRASEFDNIYFYQDRVFTDPNTGKSYGTNVIGAQLTGEKFVERVEKVSKLQPLKGKDMSVIKSVSNVGDSKQIIQVHTDEAYHKHMKQMMKANRDPKWNDGKKLLSDEVEKAKAENSLPDYFLGKIVSLGKLKISPSYDGQKLKHKAYGEVYTGKVVRVFSTATDYKKQIDPLAEYALKHSGKFVEAERTYYFELETENGLVTINTKSMSPFFVYEKVSN